MSLSNPTAKNPSTRFFQWRGGAEGEKGKETGGKVTWWEKEAEETREMPLPFTFIVLDELNTISGFSDADKSSYWSNEVRNLLTDEFTVRTSAGIKARGKYADLGDVKSRGAKYAKSVYIAYKDETGELAIGNIKIMGAALTAWIEFQKKFDVNKCAVILESAKKAKKGVNVYFIPVFDGRNMSDETKSAAVALDKEVQAYLDNYFTRRPDVTEQVDTDEAKDEEIEIEDLDSPPPKDSADPTGTEGESEPVQPKTEVEGIPLKDVPF